MSFSDWRRERLIRRTLRGLSRQRVAVILQPGNIWVIEKAVWGDGEIEETLRTCHLRGWVEPIEKAIPQGELTKEGNLPEDQLFSGVGPLYRLTEAGWNAINRTQGWLVVTCVIAFATLMASLTGLVLTLFFFSK